MKLTAFFVNLIIFSLLVNCSSSYRTLTEWEQREYQHSRFDIYPDDVKKNLSRFRNQQVAWTGIIEKAEIYENPDNMEVVLRMEHHYFNWQTSPQNSKIRYHLSSRGEGFFQTNWFLKKGADMAFIEKQFAPDNLAFVYGVPDTVINDDVILNCTYIRTVEPEIYDAEFYDYLPEGRQPEPPQIGKE